MSSRSITGKPPYAVCNLQSVSNTMHSQFITGQTSNAGIVLPASLSASSNPFSGPPLSAVPNFQSAVSSTSDNGKPPHAGLNLSSINVSGKAVEGTPQYTPVQKIPAHTIGNVPAHPSINRQPPSVDPNYQCSLFFQSAYGNIWSRPNFVPLFNTLPSSAAPSGRPLLSPPVVNSLTFVSTNNFSHPPPAFLPPPAAALGGHLYCPVKMDSVPEASCPAPTYPLTDSGFVPDLAGQLEAINVAQCEEDLVLGHSEIRVTSIQCIERSGSPGTAVTPYGRIKRPIEIRQPSGSSFTSLDPSVKEFSPRSRLNSAAISEGGSFKEETKDISFSTDTKAADENNTDDISNINNNSSQYVSTQENLDMDEIDDVQLKMTESETPDKGYSGWSTWKTGKPTVKSPAKEKEVLEDWSQQFPASRDNLLIQRNKACQTERLTFSENKKSDQDINNKKILLLQEEVCRLRAELCLNELQRQRFQLELDLFWWQSNFQPVDKSQAIQTMTATYRQHNSVLNQIESIQHKRDHCISILKSGRELDCIPHFSVGLYCGEKLISNCLVSQEGSNSGSSDALASASLVDFPSSACDVDSQSKEQPEQDWAEEELGTVEKLSSTSEKQSVGNNKVVDWLSMTDSPPGHSRVPDLRNEEDVTATAENLKRVMGERWDEKNNIPEEDKSESLVQAEENSNSGCEGLSEGGKMSDVCTDTSDANKSAGHDTQTSDINKNIKIGRSDSLDKEPHSVHSGDNESSSVCRSSEIFFSCVEPCKVEEISLSRNRVLEALASEKNVNSDSAQISSDSHSVEENDQCTALSSECEATIQQPQTHLDKGTPDVGENLPAQHTESSAISNDLMTVATELKQSLTSIIGTTDFKETQDGDTAGASSRSNVKMETEGDSAEHGYLKDDIDVKNCSSVMTELSGAASHQTLDVDDMFEDKGDEEPVNTKESGSEFKVQCEEDDLSTFSVDRADTDQVGYDPKLGVENQDGSVKGEYSASSTIKPEDMAKRRSLSEVDVFAIESDSEEDLADSKTQTCADSSCPMENIASLKEGAFDTLDDFEDNDGFVNNFSLISHLDTQSVDVQKVIERTLEVEIEDTKQNEEIVTACPKNEADSLSEKEMPCELDQTSQQVENYSVTVYKSVISKLKELFPAESKDADWLQKTAEEQTRLFIQQMNSLTQDLQGSAQTDLVSREPQPSVTPQQDIVEKTVTFAPSSQAVTSTMGSFAPSSQTLTSTIGSTHQSGYSGVNQIPAIVESGVTVNPDDWMRKIEELSACRRLAWVRQNTALQEAAVVQHTLYMLNQRAFENPANVDLSTRVDFTLKQYELLIQEAEKQSSLVTLYDQHLRSLRSQNQPRPQVSQPPLAPVKPFIAPALHQSAGSVVQPTAYSAIQNAYPHFFQPKAPPFSMAVTASLPSRVPPTKTQPSELRQSTQLVSSFSGLYSSITQPTVQCASLQHMVVSSSLPKPQPPWTAPPLNTAQPDFTSVPTALAASNNGAGAPASGIAAQFNSSGQMTSAAEVLTSSSHKRSRAETSPDRFPSSVAVSDMSAPSPPAFRPLLPLKPIKVFTNRYAALLASTAKVDKSEEVEETFGAASEKKKPLMGKMGLDDFIFGPELQSKPKPISPEKIWDFPRSDPEKEWQISGSKKYKSNEKRMPTSLSKQRDGPKAHCTTERPSWSSVTSVKKRMQGPRCLSSSSSCSDSSSESESLPNPGEVRSYQSRRRRDGNCEASATAQSAACRQNTKPSEQEAVKPGSSLTPAVNMFTFTKTLGDSLASAKALSDNQHRAKAGLPSRIDTAFINQLVSSNIANNCKEKTKKHWSVGESNSVSSSASEQAEEWHKVTKKRKGDEKGKPMQSIDQVYRSAEAVAGAKAKREPIKSEAWNRLTSYQKLLLDIEQEFPTLQMDDIKTVIEEVRKSRPSGHFHGMLFSEILKEVKSFIMINYASKLRVANNCGPAAEK